MGEIISHFEKRYFRISFRTLMLFVVIWSMVGFSTGTVTLLGPVRWITTYLRNVKVDQNAENIVVQVIIGIFVLLSAYLSVRLTGFIVHSTKRSGKIIVFSSCAVITLFSLWLWLNPQFVGPENETSIALHNASFTFGSYPTQLRLIQLRLSGYTDVISLLHPAVIPFEPQLLAEEKKMAGTIGLRILSIPMLPWVSENEDAIAKIKNLAEHGNGKYYIHCYLGRDRINVVKRILEQYKAKISTMGDHPSKILDEHQVFERGAITKLDNDIYFIPYPTDEEYLGYILTGAIKCVVSIMDSAIVENTDWIAKEKKIVTLYQIPFEQLSFDTKNIRIEENIKIIKKISSLPKPLVIHDFGSGSPASKEFIQLYLSEIHK